MPGSGGLRRSAAKRQSRQERPLLRRFEMNCMIYSKVALRRETFRFRVLAEGFRKAGPLSPQRLDTGPAHPR